MCEMKNYFINASFYSLLLYKVAFDSSGSWELTETQDIREGPPVEECQSIRRRESSRWEDRLPTQSLVLVESAQSEAEVETTNIVLLESTLETSHGDQRASPGRPEFFWSFTIPVKLPEVTCAKACKLTKAISIAKMLIFLSINYEFSLIVKFYIFFNKTMYLP